MSQPPSLRLKPHTDRRLRIGHLWVFANEVDVARTPLTGFKPGSLARLEDARGKPLGLVYVNPASLICARVLTRNAKATIDQSWFAERFRQALRLRERVYPGGYYRLLFGESDGVPGLVVDRYGDVLVAQSTTAGIDALRDAVEAALQETLSPAGIYWRCDAPVRALEGLEPETREVGVIPDEIIVPEAGRTFAASLKSGQKTGWYFDQRDNRQLVAQLAPGQRVLDVFSYIGGFGVTAAVAGAQSVTCVDASEAALELAQANAQRNGVAVETRAGDAKAVLQQLQTEQARFDLAIVDPPALIKRKKDIAAGTHHYQQLNSLAMQVLAPGGLLLAASCSHHLSADAMRGALRKAAAEAGRKLVVLAQRGAGMDHPVHPAIPETEYLKAFLCAVEG
ncbi:class I SAM-dependent rRNA methyltransferase [Abyssibacter sp.]|mgnify:CR=1 FL=1|uniref:class I SAM-dependent rRNA methyltransferase n=1 Tax=Abyssibacter sp. TaxID=2320200 RepID=UPI000C65F605|nr:class I SAM-dependent rRNA methyltransferase [Abyssibacter sp.]MBB87618.1 RlmI/RlmK family 23S rRNA methyltransferase [Xanthomonadales bacterium]MCK5860343.1 class I SAM-dependent rRNA methyltransferase [Abyssibacter sp.]